jgi:hypothetical protein
LTTRGLLGLRKKLKRELYLATAMLKARTVTSPGLSDRQ